MDQALIQANRYRFFLVGAVGTFMATLDGSILNVALPSIAADLGADIDLVAWVVLAYTLTVISLMLIFGAWTERKGYEFAYKFGYIFFVVGSLACALSPAIYPLIGARVVQGIGSAMFQAVGPGLVATVFPAEQRGRGIGLMVMMVAAGLMAGPPIGGFLLQFFPWQAIFVINLPIGIVGIALAARYFRLLPKPDLRAPMHLAGGLAIALSLSSGTFALSMLADHALTSLPVIVPAAVAVLAFLAFLHFESRPGKNLIGLTMFRNRQFATAITAAILIFVSMSGALILMPFYLHHIKNLEPSTIGLYLVILPAIMFIFAPLSGRLSDKIGFRFLTTLGMALAALGLYLFTRIQVDSTAAYIITALVVVGIGVAIFNTPNSSSIMGSVSTAERARASSIIGTSRNIGTSVGIALATALFAFFRSAYAPEIPDQSQLFVVAYHRVAWIMLLVAIAALPFCVVRQNRPRPAIPDTAPAHLGEVD